MIVHADESITPGERVRVTWEGGYLVTEQFNQEYDTFDTWDGGRVSMPTTHRYRLAVDNPERVWIQSIDPAKVRERIAGEYPNPDAVLLQTKLDAAHAEIERLRATAVQHEANFQASKVLWKKRHRDEYWLEAETLSGIARAIERGEPEPDPIDW